MAREVGKRVRIYILRSQKFRFASVNRNDRPLRSQLAFPRIGRLGPYIFS